jgi:YidC/Oxa1 family membrane protein insertase
MDIQRTVLWIVFSMSLLLLWDNWMRYTGKPSMFLPNSSQPAGEAPPGAGPQRADVPVSSLPALSPQAVPSGQAAIKSERVTITTDLVKAEIDTLGGELVRLELLKHRDGEHPDRNIVLFDASKERTYLGQSGLIGGPFPNHKTLFTAQPGARSIGGGNTLQLVMEASQGGVKLTKTFVFRRGDYAIDIKHAIANNSDAPIAPSLYLQLVRDGSKPPGESMFYSTFTGPAMYTETDRFQKIDFDKIEKGKTEHALKSDNGWIALVQHYFVSAFIPPEKAQREIFTKKIDVNLYAVGTILPLGSIAPGAAASMDARLFAGPQESTALEKTAPGLELVKDYGVLTILAKPIFWLMEQLYKLLNNWGWTIVALTILIKLAFFPLSAASYRSMAKMKTVTPKITALRERHKGDAAKMNQAMMEMYKTEKINPLGGCLPILVQIPVFIALYWVLLASVEMRNAPWIGWIKDLAAPDALFGTYHIGSFTLPIGLLPIIMAVSMFIQTKLNPTPPDPLQAKIMLFMPLIFSAMFFFFPSGLVLYWVVNNILSIAQQWAITKKMEAAASA